MKWPTVAYRLGAVALPLGACIALVALGYEQVAPLTTVVATFLRSPQDAGKGGE